MNTLVDRPPPPGVEDIDTTGVNYDSRPFTYYISRVVVIASAPGYPEFSLFFFFLLGHKNHDQIKPLFFTNGWLMLMIFFEFAYSRVKYSHCENKIKTSLIISHSFF